MENLIQPECSVCQSHTLNVFFELLNVPVFCNLLWPKKAAAIDCPKGEMKLAFCKTCGFITNIAFDPQRLEYTQAYENSLDFSPRFQSYATSLAVSLVTKHHLYHKKIIEIGCGKGDFLLLLCELGENKGVGFDPSYIDHPNHSKVADKVTFIRDFYSEAYANYQADFIGCRHALEHIPNPTNLLKMLRSSIGDRLSTVIFFEVPNALDTFRNLGVWDIIYEHCHYFSPVSLAYAFSAAGFEVQEVREEFAGQFLCLEAVPGQINAEDSEKIADEVKELEKDIANFSTNFSRKIQLWQKQLEQLNHKGQRAVIWGAGSKGVTFLNVLGTQNQIEYAVDINPRKQGMYIPGTGQKIVAPEFLKDYQPEIAIAMNPIYQSEIQKMIQDLGLKTEVISIDQDLI